MEQRSLSRRVKVLDTSNQLSLFDPVNEEERAKLEIDARRPSRAVKFETPDPRVIAINQVRLDDHLRGVGLTMPLKLRGILEDLCFSDFESRYRPGGRPPYAPRARVGILLYGLVQGVSSLRDLERLSRLAVGCWWLSGGIMPDHSVLGRFVVKHDDLLSADLFEQLTLKVLQVTGSGTATVAGDGTVIEAMCSRFQMVREEALNEAIAQQRDQAQSEPENDAGRHRVAQLEQVKAELAMRQEKQAAKGKDPAKTRIHPNEPDAVFQPQKNAKDCRPSYKPSVLANDARIILSYDVHASSETGVIAGLLDRAQRLGPIQTTLLDAGYFTENVIHATEARDIELLCPEGQSFGEDWNKQSGKRFPKSQFDYLPDEDAYRCPNQQTLTRSSQHRGSATAPGYTVYSTAACSSCPLKAQCTRSRFGRKIKCYACDDKKDAIRAKMATPEQRLRYRSRQAMVEPVFSHLRGRQGLKRFHRKGLSRVKVEFALHAMAYNLSRLIALAVFLNELIIGWRRRG